MGELKSCLCDEGVSDVQFTGEDGGWDMEDFWSAQRRGLDWCKRCSWPESDGVSPEALFLRWEKWRLTWGTVGLRLASRATASSKVK